MFFFFNFSDSPFTELPAPKPIDLEAIGEFISDGATKRIHFGSTHANALKTAANGMVWLNLPFDEPLESIAKSWLKIKRFLYPPKNGSSFYRRIASEEERNAIASLIEELKDLVFLRDCLDLSIALSMHEYHTTDGNVVRTELGEHEYQVKYNTAKDTTANQAALTAEMQHRLDTLPFFKHADYIMAVPSSRPFMRNIINGLQGFSFSDISNQVAWTDKNGSLKDLNNPEKKLELINSWEITFAPELNLKGKTVLIVDDMYKSGVTMQYIAMKLKEAGAKRVFGICLCKALGNK